MNRRSGESGFTLIELIMFIVIVSVALVAILQVLNISVSKSVDPLTRKQALTIAEAMMDEILARDYQNDDTDSANTSSTVGCTTTTTIACPSNVANRSNYNDVSDYAGWSGSASQPDGGAIASTIPFNVAVTISATTWNGIPAKLVSVTVSGGSHSIILQGYRGSYDCDNTLAGHQCP